MLGQLALAENVIVALHETPSAVSGQTVRVGDVASVFGGTAWDRKNIAQLDLESLQDQSQCSITRKQVEMRLLLAGYQRNSIQVTGPPFVQTRLTSPVQLRRELEQKLVEELSRQFAVQPERVAVHLTNATHLQSLEKALTPGELSIELVPRNEFPVGRSRLRIDVIGPDGMRQPLALDAQVSLAMKVAIASQPIPRGTVIKAGMFRMVDRAVTERADYLNPENAIGKTASRYIGNNSILLASHLAASRGAASTVKRNGLLDVVIKLAGSEIRLKDARAMESGAVGDTIQVLNPQTNRRINALIIGPNLATISSHPRRL